MPERLAAIRNRHADRRLLIFHQDEARFGQQGTLTRVWAPTGSRPTAVKQTEYEYLRSHFWSNRWYEDYDDLMQAAIDAWRKAALVPDLMKSVCRAL